MVIEGGSGSNSKRWWRWWRRRRTKATSVGGDGGRRLVVVVAAFLLLVLATTATNTTALQLPSNLALHLLGPRVWNHSLPLAALLDGVSHPGGAAARARLAALARELAAAATPDTPPPPRPPIRVVALGGSITCGHMVEKGKEDWFSLLTKEFFPRAFPLAAAAASAAEKPGGNGSDTAPAPATPAPATPAPAARLRARNGCIPATQSEMASLCLDRVLRGEDEDDYDPSHAGADLVLVEFSVNDGYASSPSPDHARARAFERLLRTVMRRGRRRRLGLGGGTGGGKKNNSPQNKASSSPPVVVLVHLLPTDAHKLNSPFFASAETDYDVLARYYGLPSVSLRAALWHRLFAGQPGFSRRDMFPETEERHPTPLGHRYVADLVVWLLQRAVLEEELGAGVFAGDGGEGDSTLPHPHLGPPMFPGNHESRTQACLMAEDLPAAVVYNKGWRWTNDAKHKNATTPKWGYASDEVGATLVLRLDTRAHADDGEKDGDEGRAGGTRRRRRRLAVVPAEEVADAEARGLLLPPLPTLQPRPGQRRLLGKKKQPNPKKPTTPSSPAPPFDPEDATIPAEQTLPPAETPKDMFVWLGYVASWRQVGSAVVWCARHCRCDARIVDAWHASKTTQQVAARLPATQSPKCWVAIRVLNETSTGGHRFKVTGAMVGRRAEEGLFGDASEMTLMEAFNPGGGEGVVAEAEEGEGEGKGGGEG